jgi:hypothetical protein
MGLESCLFKYYNINPEGKHTTDCTVRAISLISGKKYNSVKKGLVEYKKITGSRTYNESKNAKEYLESLGGVWKKAHGTIKVREFALAHPTGAYVLNMKGHYSAMIDGAVYDTWDTRDELLISFCTLPVVTPVPKCISTDCERLAEYLRHCPYMKSDVKRRLITVKRLLRECNTQYSNELYWEADRLLKMSEEL